MYDRILLYRYCFLLTYRILLYRYCFLLTYIFIPQFFERAAVTAVTAETLNLSFKVSISSRDVTRRVPNVEFYSAGRHGRAPLRCYSEMTNHNVYNARAFFVVHVLVYVGAPVREVAFHGKRYTRVLYLSFSFSFSLCLSPRVTLPLAHFHPSSSSPPPSTLLFSSCHSLSLFYPFARSRTIGPRYRSLVLTRLIQMNRGLSDVSREANWILKIKRKRSRVADPPKPTGTYE